MRREEERRARLLARSVGRFGGIGLSEVLLRARTAPHAPGLAMLHGSSSGLASEGPCTL